MMRMIFEDIFAVTGDGGSSNGIDFVGQDPNEKIREAQTRWKSTYTSYLVERLEAVCTL